MELYKLEEMVKGWLIGNFCPTLFSTNEFEIGIKRYRAGDSEDSHHHRIATEFTVILYGVVEMSGNKYYDGDIIKIKPGESTDFVALTDVTTVVIKVPGANDDKYID